MNEVIQAVPKISDVVDAKGKQCNFVSCALLSVFRGIFLSKIYPSASNMWHEKSFFFYESHLYRDTFIFILCGCFALQIPVDFYEPQLGNLSSVLKISTPREVVLHSVKFCSWESC